MNELSDLTLRKFIEEYDLSDYEIETDCGFVDINKLLVTIKYEKYYIKTKNNLVLYCADNHILYDEFYNEKYAKNFQKHDKIITKYGIDEVIDVHSTNVFENMYDLQLTDESKHRYYTNGFLSHNTLIAKKLAQEVFGSENDLVRIDMSEYSDKSSVTKMLGSSPGFIGYENGGQLTEAIKNKQHCVLLLDEIEKAHEEVFNIFLQVFDEGRLTDNSGQLVNFKNVIVLMTSNVGAKKASELGNGLGFINNVNENKKNIIEKELKKTFKPEFINRIDKIVYFNSLTDENLKDIINLELQQLNSKMEEINFSIEYDDDTINFIHEMAIKEKEYGARPIKRIIQTYVEDEITNLLLTNEYENNYTFKTFIKDGKLHIE